MTTSGRRTQSCSRSGNSRFRHSQSTQHRLSVPIHTGVSNQDRERSLMIMMVASESTSSSSVWIEYAMGRHSNNHVLHMIMIRCNKCCYEEC